MNGGTTLVNAGGSAWSIREAPGRAVAGRGLVRDSDQKKEERRLERGTRTNAATTLPRRRFLYCAGRAVAVTALSYARGCWKNSGRCGARKSGVGAALCHRSTKRGRARSLAAGLYVLRRQSAAATALSGARGTLGRGREYLRRLRTLESGVAAIALPPQYKKRPCTARPYRDAVWQG